MATRPLKLRHETPADIPVVDALLRAAFPGPAEALLVEQLRRAGDLQQSLVGHYGTDIAGVAIFSRVSVESLGDLVPGIILAPVAVAAPWQRQGIGSELIRAGLRQAQLEQFAFAVVLGEPDYYGRFGFTASAGEIILSPWSGPYWQALIWNAAIMPRQPTPLQYPAAFAALT